MCSCAPTTPGHSRWRVNTANARRSSRVRFELPIRISGEDTAGRPFVEAAETLSVSNHGALLLCRQPLSEGAEVELAAFLGTPPRRARVVRLLGRNTERQLWKVAAELATPGNFWKLAAPPEDWQRAEAARPHLVPGPPCALVLDDDPELLRLVEASLGREGFRVTALEDPRQLEAALLAGEYSVVISDLQMPHRSGIQVLQILRERAPALSQRFILMTGNPAEAEKHSKELLGVRVMPKPFSLAKLAEAARKMLPTIH